jgi:hypothetical protein
MTAEEEAAALDALKRRVKALEASWRTSLKEDEAFAAAIEERGAEGAGERVAEDGGERERDERMGNIVGLRLNKKRLARRVAEMLDSLTI